MNAHPWRFDWLTPGRILFGDGRIAELGGLAAGMGNRLCLVTGGASLRVSGRLDTIAGQFDAHGLRWLHLRIDGEPTAERIDELTEEAREFHPHLIVAVGGGSAIDAGKAAAALLANGGKTIDYLEGVGRGAALAAASLPLIAAPTTAGTGSEATKNAVIGDRARTFKKSMRGDGMMPTVALVDPELTHDCPPAVTAACGMDALTQLIEAHTSRRANAMSEMPALRGLMECAALGKLEEATNRRPLRCSLSLASLIGGICLANVGLGAVHGLVSPLGAFFPVPHGAGCAALLAAVVRVNTRRARDEAGAALATVQKYQEITELLNLPSPEDPFDGALALAEHVEGLVRRLGLPGLGHYGVTAADFPRIVAGARGNSMKTNPVDLSDDDLIEILETSL